jgi:Queuosine biosynthesis protein QueC
VSGSTGPRLRGLQSDLSFGLAQRFAGRVTSAAVRFGLANRARRADRKDENTQRARGFVFSALGAVTAISAGLDELSIYENGPGAINLPFTARQLGVHLTRATNPLALKRMETLIEALTNQPFRIRLPFLLETKAVLCNSIRDAGVEHLIARTISCDGFPQRVERHPQCGLCTSCLLRRMSLHAAGLTDHDPRNYRVDVLHPDWSAPEEKLFPFRAMLYQAELLSAAVTSPSPWRALVTSFPELLEVAAAAGDGSATFTGGGFLDLYRQYCSEWGRFPARPGGYEAALAA